MSVSFLKLYTNSKNNRAFSAVEMIVIIGLGIIVTTISLSAFTRFKKGNQVDRAAEQVISLFKTARYQTLSSKNGAFYGVALASSTVTMYPNVYVANNSNNTLFNFDDQVIISGASLSPSTTTISFSRFTGEANATGTVTLSLKTNNAILRKVTIHKSGLVE